jgi:histidinol phosphatase-like enzyme
MVNNAIFLDRDGTINEDVGDLYTIDKLVLFLMP